MNLFEIKAKNLKVGDTLQFIFSEIVDEEKINSWSAYNDFLDFAKNASKIGTYKVRHHLCKVEAIKQIKQSFDLFGQGITYQILLEDTSTGEKFIFTETDKGNDKKINRASRYVLHLFE